MQEFYEKWRYKIAEAAAMEGAAAKTAAYAVLFDGLAAVKYPGSHAKGLTLRFVETSASWPDKWRVSIFQLRAHLEAMFSPAENTSSRLYRCVRDSLSSSFSGSPDPGFEGDPFLYELDSLATPEEYPALQWTRYVSLFETERRKTLEKRNRFYSPETSSRRSPFYRQADGVWYLVFPHRFYHDLLLDCLENLGCHLSGKKPGIPGDGA